MVCSFAFVLLYCLFSDLSSRPSRMNDRPDVSRQVAKLLTPRSMLSVFD